MKLFESKRLIESVGYDINLVIRGGSQSSITFDKNFKEKQAKELAKLLKLVPVFHSAKLTNGKTKQFLYLVDLENGIWKLDFQGKDLKTVGDAIKSLYPDKSVGFRQV